MPALKHEQIAESLFTWWRDQFPLAVTTAYPGMRIDTVPLDEWLEIHIDTWSRRPQRIGGRQLIDLSITVHSFVKQQSDKSRIHGLADAVRDTLSQKTVPLRDYDSSGSAVVGYALLFEPEVRDLTRSDMNSLRHPMQHLVVLCPGIAQQA